MRSESNNMFLRVKRGVGYLVGDGGRSVEEACYEFLTFFLLVR